MRDRPGPTVPVLLLTGAFDPVDAGAGSPPCGASAVLAKPFEPQVLVSKVRALLARHRRAAGHGLRSRAAGHTEAPAAVEALTAHPAEPRPERRRAWTTTSSVSTGRSPT